MNYPYFLISVLNLFILLVHFYFNIWTRILNGWKSFTIRVVSKKYSFSGSNCILIPRTYYEHGISIYWWPSYYVNLKWTMPSSVFEHHSKALPFQTNVFGPMTSRHGKTISKAFYLLIFEEFWRQILPLTLLKKWKNYCYRYDFKINDQEGGYLLFVIFVILARMNEDRFKPIRHRSVSTHFVLLSTGRSNLCMTSQDKDIIYNFVWWAQVYNNGHSKLSTEFFFIKYTYILFECFTAATLDCTWYMSYKLAG